MASGSAQYAKGLGRAFGGAVLFTFPLIMTMEMWSLGFSMERERLILFFLLNLAVLVGLSHFAGFEATTRWRDDVMDAFAAVAVGALAALVMLGVFAVVEPDTSADEIVGKVALQTVPASIGAMLARKQLGARESDRVDELKRAGYPGELFLMAVGALFLAFNVAPTEEMVLIAYKMTHWHALVLIALSVVAIHALVYAVGFAGQERPPEGASFGTTLLHYSVAGYGIALLVSLYALWTFGRTDGVSLSEVVQMTAVLGFPASLGAASARLIV